MEEYITLLLPCYLDGFIPIFNRMGFAVLHSFNLKVLEIEIRKFNPDLALEWQHGPDDFQIRDVLMKCKKEVPVFLCLNWNNKVPPDFPRLGYHDYLSVPWELDDLMGKFHEALPESRKPILKDLWKKVKMR